MATKTASVIQSGTSNYLTPAESFNVVATDLLTPGIVGSYTNTSGVSPATGSFAVNAQGSPNMTVAVSAGQAYVSATPTGGTAQNIRVKMTSSEDVTITANSTGSTRYDFIYVKVDADKLNNPAADGTDVVTLVAQRSTTQDADSNGALANALLIAVVTVSNGAVSIANANVTDRRLPVNSQTDGWQQANETWTYLSATSVTVPTGAAFKYSVGDKVKYMQSGVWKYAYVTGVTATTLTLNGGSDYTIANATIAAPCFSKRATPVGFPQVFNFTPTWASLSGGTSTYARFSIVGRVAHVEAKYVLAGAGVSGTPSLTLPVAVNTGFGSDGALNSSGVFLDSGNNVYVAAITYSSSAVSLRPVVASGTYASFGGAASSTVPFTWGNGDEVSLSVSYTIA